MGNFLQFGEGGEGAGLCPKGSSTVVGPLLRYVAEHQGYLIGLLVFSLVRGRVSFYAAPTELGSCFGFVFYKHGAPLEIMATFQSSPPNTTSGQP